MKTKIILALISTVTVCSCAQLKIQDYDQTFKDRGHSPVIVASYAPPIIPPGSTWRIYLRAEDEDGDMLYIATMLYQEGFGYYATDYTRLEGRKRRGFAGYISLKTPADVQLSFDQFTMEIMVRDSQGKQSNIVHLPLAFGSVKTPEVPAEWQDIADNRLGVLVTRIQSTAGMAEVAGSR